MEPRVFAKRYDFELDDFQKEAIRYLSQSNSVLVSAPTGSGKTLIAEYALLDSLERGEKFFYTTPLKALSNQKFRDLSDVYGRERVGLLTGDNGINPEAPIVVMTTEVLRNMIYEESERLSGLRIVVLDEVHYMNDPFRGAVWEEIVIMLPLEVKIVALSATVPNAHVLGSWLESVRGKTKVVVSKKRPVELEQYYYIGKSLIPLFSPKLFDSIRQAMEAGRMEEKSLGQKASRKRRPVSRLKRAQVVMELRGKKMLPAIYFLFSRNACDDSVSRLLSEGKTLTTEHEASEIENYLGEKTKGISRADLETLGYPLFRRALKSGIAVHHAGIFPLFKEAVEELFARGLVKVVFATETLSLGINMPARSVVIESFVKWTGSERRPLTSGEYKQLTGRAGRRGIDEAGYSVILHQGIHMVEQIRAIAKAEPPPVVSSFKVSYNMVVNMLEDHDIEQTRQLLNMSFAQFEADRSLVDGEAELEKMKREYEFCREALRCEEGDARGYRKLQKDLSKLSSEMQALARKKAARAGEALSVLSPGDVFLVGDLDTGALFALAKRSKSSKGPFHVVDPSGRLRRISPQSLKGRVTLIGSIPAEKITSPNKRVRKSACLDMETLLKGFPSLPSPEVSSGEKEIYVKRMKQLKEKIVNHPCERCEHKGRCLEAARRLETLGRQMKRAKKKMDASFNVVSRDLDDVVEVLREFDCLRGEEVTEKGKVLAKIYNECDLLLVEVLEKGWIESLEPAELTAFCSWFIYESREGEVAEEVATSRKRKGQWDKRLVRILEKINVTWSSIKAVEALHGLDFLGSIDPGFGRAAYMWAEGSELSEILAEFPEWSVGDMVRTMKQIIDLMRQMCVVLEEGKLKSSLKEAMVLVDRGVVGFSSIESMIEREEEITEEL